MNEFPVIIRLRKKDCRKFFDKELELASKVPTLLISKYTQAKLA